jgi:predicted amidohydrolase
MYRVAALQMLPVLFDVDANLAKIASLLSGVCADLIVLPELCTTGYVFGDKAELEAVAEQVPRGKSFVAMAELSRSLEASIVYGCAEKVRDKIFNSSVLINPDGSFFIYRKTHLFFREKLFFTPGDTGLQVYPAKGGIRIGMMICFDWQFPEAARILALKGAQVICHPSNLVLPWCQQAMLTRSLENRVYSITANRIGTETNGENTLTFTGQSQIVSTIGDVLSRLSIDSEAVSVVEIDPGLADDKAVTPMNNAFSDRRPAFYTDIVKSKEAAHKINEKKKKS